MVSKNFLLSLLVLLVSTHASSIRDIADKVKKIIADELYVDARAVTPEASFKTLGTDDELDRLEVVMDLEDAFEVTFSHEDTKKILTVQDAIDYVNMYVKGLTVPDKFGQNCWLLGCDQEAGVCDQCGTHNGRTQACCRQGWSGNNPICEGAVYDPSMSDHHHCVVVPSSATEAAVGSTVKERVCNLVVDNTGGDESECTLEASFADDLGLDSLDLVELVMDVEEEFGIDIPDDDAEMLRTVQDAVDYITKRTGGAAAGGTVAFATPPSQDTPVLVNVFAAVGAAFLCYGAFRHYVK